MTTLLALGGFDAAPVRRRVRRVLAGEGSHQVSFHSHGFNWGYYGSGPGQLALALLLLVTDEETAFRLHGFFKEEVVATWPFHESFTYSVHDLREWLARHPLE